MATPVEIAAIAFINGILGVLWQSYRARHPRKVDPYLSNGMLRPKSARQKPGVGDVADKWGGTLNRPPSLLEDLRPVDRHLLEDVGDAGDIAKH